MNFTCGNGRQPNDVAWLLSTGMSVLSMQAGFALLESGSVRSLNSVNELFKNCADLTLGILVWWMCGWGLAYGQDFHGFIGTGAFLPDQGLDYEMFFFQGVFASTAATIDSGAVVERMPLSVYIALSALMTGFTYPVVAHWAWHPQGWLAQLGYIDFAGASVVHLVGGASALWCSWWLGPRLGTCNTKTYPDDLNRGMMQLHLLTKRAFKGSQVNVLFGTLLLCFGWLAFNCGSTLAMSNGGSVIAGRVAFVTVLGLGFGGMTAVLWSRLILKYYSASSLSVGMLSGLVGITAAPNILTGWAAALTAVLSAVLACSSVHLLDRIGIDDPVAVVPVHVVASFPAVVMPALVGQNTSCGTNLDTEGLLFGGGFSFLGIQLLGYGVIFTWSSLCTICFLFLASRVCKIQIRLSSLNEIVGEDMFSHDIDSFEGMIACVRLQEAFLDNKDLVRVCRKNSNLSLDVFNVGDLSRCIDMGDISNRLAHRKSCRTIPRNLIGPGSRHDATIDNSEQ